MAEKAAEEEAAGAEASAPAPASVSADALTVDGFCYKSSQAYN